MSKNNSKVEISEKVKKKILSSTSPAIIWIGKNNKSLEERTTFRKISQALARRHYEAGEYNQALDILLSIEWEYRSQSVHERIVKIYSLLGYSDLENEYISKLIDAKLVSSTLLERYISRLEDATQITFSLLNSSKDKISPQLIKKIQTVEPAWKRRDLLLNLNEARSWSEPLLLNELVIAQFRMRAYAEIVGITTKYWKLFVDQNNLPAFVKNSIIYSYCTTEKIDAFSLIRVKSFFAQLGIDKNYILNTYIIFLVRQNWWNEGAKLQKIIARSEGSEANNYAQSSYKYRLGFKLDEAIEDSRLALAKSNSRDHLVLLAGNFEIAGQYEKAAEIYEYLCELSPNSKYYVIRMVYCFYKSEQINRAYIKVEGYLNKKWKLDSMLRSDSLDRSAAHKFAVQQDSQQFTAEDKLKALLDQNLPHDSTGASLEIAKRYIKSKNYELSKYYAKLALFESYKNFEESLEILSICSIQDSNLESSVRLFLASYRPIAYQIDSNYYKKTSNVAKTMSTYIELSEVIPVDSNIYLFESHHGSSIDCNPLAICKQLLNKPSFDGLVIWAVKPGAKIPKDLEKDQRVVTVQRGTFVYWVALAISGKLINNVTFPQEFVRRPEQIYMNTWHGTPIKTLGRDIKTGVFEHANTARNFVQANILIFPNEFTRNVQINHYDVSNLITAKSVVTGYPRNDVLVESNPEIKKNLTEKLGLDFNKPIAFYAPTWRGGQGTEHFDVDKLVSDLQKLSKSEYQIVFRGHSHSQKYLANVSLPVVVPPNDISSYDLMQISDILITDYSSIGIDFLATGRTTIWYCYDMDQYDSERGLYLSAEQFPGKIVFTIEDLIKYLDSPESKEPYKLVGSQKQFVEFEDGKASERAVELLLNHEETKLISKKKRILFRHSFIPNGITSALVGLISNLNPDKYDITVAFDRHRAQENSAIVDVLNSLPVWVNRVGSQGSRAKKTDWLLAERQLSSTYLLESNTQISVLAESWSREATRLFGYNSFDAVVEFEGYSLHWAGVLSQVHTLGPRLFYLHSDMRGELKYRFPWLKAVHSISAKYYNLVALNEPLHAINTQLIEKSSGEKLSPSYILDNTIDVSQLIEKSICKTSDQFNMWREENRPLIAIVGRLSVEKNQTFVVNAINGIEKNERPQLVLVGGGALESEILDIIQTNELVGDVFVTGNVENPIPYYLAADFLLIPSLHEGQPMVLHEAMATGLPVATVPIAGCVDWINRFGGTILPDRSYATMVNFLRNVQRRSAKDSISSSVNNYKKLVIDSSVSEFEKIID